MHLADDVRLGRFYTPPALADLVLELALDGNDSPIRLWDPTCGDGSFLRAAHRRGLAPSTLQGTDIDREALAILQAALPAATLRHVDLFDLDPNQAPPCDIIVGNPPFLRAERVPPAQRRTMRARLSAAIGLPVGGSVDVSLIALAWCLCFLRPGGRLAFVLPSTVLDVASGASLRAWITANHHVEYVLDSPSEPWFLHAAVNTVVLVIQKAPPAATSFVRLKLPPKRALGSRVRGSGDEDVRVRRSPPEALAAHTWSSLLRAPDVWFEVLGEARSTLVPTRARLTLSYGTKPGISAFFAPRPPPDVEPRFLRPFLRSLRGHHRYAVSSADTSDRLFVVPSTEPELLPPRARRYIERGSQTLSTRGVPFPEVPSVRGNTPWWRLPSPRSGPVLVPQFRSERHHIIENPDLIPVNNSAWHGRWRDPAHAAVGVALMNSTWAALGAEVLGRTNLGEGLLTLYGPELGSLPIPDPAQFLGPLEEPVLRAWARMRQRAALPLWEEVLQKDRQALDAAILQGMGVSAEFAGRIASAAVDLLQSRLNLAKKRRGHEDAPR